MSEPIVSVIMPTFNAGAFIVTALRSILQERGVSLEVVVVDDGSTDASIDQAKSLGDPRVRVVANQGKGISSAMNTGLSAARGSIVMRCDADDLYPPGRIALQAEWLDSHPDFGAVCGGFSALDKAGSPVVDFSGETVSGEITEELCQGTTRTHLCTFAIRKDLCDRLGGFRAFFKTAEDIDFQLRLGELCRIWYFPQAAYHWRLHNDSITHTQGRAERERYETLAREFLRQRQDSGSDDLQRGVPPVVVSSPDSDRALSADRQIQGHLLGLAWQHLDSGRKLAALKTGVRAVRLAPASVSAWRSLLMLLIKSAQASAR